MAADTFMPGAMPWLRACGLQESTVGRLPPVLMITDPGEAAPRSRSCREKSGKCRQAQSMEWSTSVAVGCAHRGARAMDSLPHEPTSAHPSGVAEGWSEGKAAVDAAEEPGFAAP